MSETAAPGFEARLKRGSAIAASFGVLMILALVNRKLRWSGMDAHVLDVMRVRDFDTVFVIAPLCVWLVWDYIHSCSGHLSRAVTGVFVMSVFLLGLSFGMHEPALAMMVAGYGSIPKAGESIAYFKEIPGHWLFFLGFAIMTFSACMAEMRKPYEKDLPSWAMAIACFAGLATALSIFGNMFKDPRSGRDMFVVCLSLAATFGTHWRYGFPGFRRAPFALVIYLGYGLSSAAVFLYWSLFPSP